MVLPGNPAHTRSRKVLRAPSFGAMLELGVLLLGSIGPALVFLHVQPQWEKAVQGLVILLAVASDAFGREGR